MQNKCIDDSLFSKNKIKFYNGLNRFFEFHNAPDGSKLVIDDVRGSIYESCNVLLVSEYREGLIPEIQTYINDDWRYDQYRWGANMMEKIKKCVDRKISKFVHDEEFKNNQKIFLEKLDKCFEWDIKHTIDGFSIIDVKDNIEIHDFQKCNRLIYEIEDYIKENICASDNFGWGIQTLECMLS